MEFVSFDIESNDFRRAGAASRAIKEHLKRIGAAPEAVRRTMIATYEAEMNVVIHSVGGRLEAALSDSRIDVNVIDEGPGIPDIELAMTEGYSTASPEARALGFGAGMGLPNIKRNSDRLRVTSRPGEGTRVSFTVFLRSASDGSGQAGQSPPISLYASADRCRDCRACLTACPTQALRVREGRPSVLEHLCIDCTECISACSSQALGLPQDCPSLADLEDLATTTLVVPPGLLAGCGAEYPPASVLEGLRRLGFAEVVTAEPFVAALRDEGLAMTGPVAPYDPVSSRTVILPTCPAVTNLLQLRYPSLLPQLAPFISPWEALVLSGKSRRLAFVVSCPAQRSALLRCTANPGPEGTAPDLEFLLPETVRQAALAVLSRGTDDPEVSHPSPPAHRPLSEPAAKPNPPAPVTPTRTTPGLLTVTGIRQVAAVLELMEDGLLPDVAVLEPYACRGGCFGTPLLALDHHVSSYRWLRATPLELTAESSGTTGLHVATGSVLPAAVRRPDPLQPRPGVRLDPDMGAAIRKLGELQALIRALPGKDCGVCGAPSCAALAEDVVRGRVGLDLCPYRTPDREEVDL